MNAYTVKLLYHYFDFTYNLDTCALFFYNTLLTICIPTPVCSLFELFYKITITVY